MKDNIIKTILDSETLNDAAASVGDYVTDAHGAYADAATTAAREVSQVAISAHDTLVDTTAALVDEAQRYASDAYTSLKGQFTGWFNTTSGAEAQAITMTAEEAFKNLPTTSVCDMPPEVQSLIEVKTSEELFRQHFEELQQHGSLDKVIDYLRKQPVVEEAAPAMTPDVELDRGTPTTANRLPSLG